jgi:hypothetical protein
VLGGVPEANTATAWPLVVLVSIHATARLAFLASTQLAVCLLRY